MKAKRIEWREWALEVLHAPRHAALRKRVMAGAASVAAHLLLFLVLAIVTAAPSSELAKPRDEEASQSSAEEAPLEVVFLPPPKEEAAAVVPVIAPEGAETYQLDPENLKESATPPEHARLLASHHSEGNATPKPQLRAGVPPPPEPPTGEGELVIGGPAEPSGETVAAIGAWKKALGNAIGLRWDHYRKTRASSLVAGSVRLTFRIDAKGNVSNIRVLSNTGNPNNALLAVRAAKEARIPPIPSDRLRKLPGGTVDVELTLTILPHS